MGRNILNSGWVKFIWQDDSSPLPGVPQVLITVQEVNMRQGLSALDVSFGPLIVLHRLIGREIVDWREAGYPIDLDRRTPLASGERNR